MSTRGFTIGGPFRRIAGLAPLRRRIEPGSAAWYFRRDRAAMISVGIIVIIVLAAILAPWLTPYADQGRGTPDASAIFEAPSRSHPMGTDELGRDVLARVLFGARSSLTISVVVVAFGAVFGTALGALAGYFGGWVDELIMRVTDVFLSFPPLLLAIALAAALQPSLQSAIIAISIVWWPWYTRLARAQAVVVREHRYVLAARTMGAGRASILWRHVRPNIMGPIRVQAALDLGAAILAGAALSFLGLGPQPPTPDWGLMISEGRQFLVSGNWWVSVFPGLAIYLTAVSCNFIADGFDAMSDPRAGSRA